MRANESAFSQVQFRPRTLVDVSQRSVATSVVGIPVAAPLVLAPRLQLMVLPERVPPSELETKMKDREGELVNITLVAVEGPLLVTPMV